MADDKVKYDRLKLLVYGSPGCGKTRFIASVLDLPEDGYLPALFLDFEEGQRSARSLCNTIERTVETKFVQGQMKQVSSYNVDQLNNPDPKKLNRLQVSTWDDFRTIYSLLTTQVTIGLYKTLIIDSISHVDRLCQDAVAKNTMAAPFDVKPITQPEMGQLGTHIVWLIDAFLRTGAHLICTAHITEKNDPGYTSSTDLPMLTGIKLRQQVCGICDCVGYMYTYDSKDFNLTFNKSLGSYAKFRSEDPLKFAGKVFTSNIDPKVGKQECNLLTFLKTLGDIKE